MREPASVAGSRSRHVTDVTDVTGDKRSTRGRFKSYDSADFRSRVKAYAYNTLFWLPGDEQTGMREGLLRLDRVQPVHTSLLGAKPVKLTGDALNGLIAWYGCYLRGMVPEKLREYRDTALAQLSEAGSTPEAKET